MLEVQGSRRMGNVLMEEIIDNKKGAYPKTKFGRCTEGKLHLACREAGHPEDRP